MKRLRHLLGIYNVEEKDFLKRKESVLKDQKAQVEKRAEDVSSRDYKEDEAMAKRINDICPKCKSNTVVDKITRLQGEGNISGSFFLGSGSIYGSSSMDTNEVNNCNNCGHQRKKYELTRNSKDKVIGLVMTYLDWSRDEGGEKYMSRDNILKMKSMGIYKETLYELNKEYNDGKYIGLDDLDRLEYPKMK